MACNFDMDSEYVKRVVKKSLDGIEAFPKACQLLTFLVMPLEQQLYLDLEY
jgi:hypothetical protein